MGIVKFEIIKNNQKRCSKCHIYKDFSEFFKSSTNTYCIVCSREYRKHYHSQEKVKKKHAEYALKSHFKKKYGITIDQYQKMLLNQNGVCAICKLPETVISKKTGNPMQLSVDHCHRTKKVRSLLCNRCNKGIGYFKEDINLFNACVQYLLLFRL